jgi:hypothetical protein
VRTSTGGAQSLNWQNLLAVNILGDGFARVARDSGGTGTPTAPPSSTTATPQVTEPMSDVVEPISSIPTFAG